MKIKTTMLSGVAGALALAAFLSAPAYGAAHLMPATIPTVDYGDVVLLDPDTDPITGDIRIAKDAEDSVVLPSDSELDPISPELQNAVVDDGVNELFSPLSVEGQEDQLISGQSGVEIQDEGNVSLFATTQSEDQYRYDLARKIYVWDETEPGAPTGSNGLPVTDGDGVNGTLIEEAVYGYWDNSGEVPVFVEYDGAVFLADDPLTLGVDESEFLDPAFKSWLATEAGDLNNLNGDPYVTIGEATTSGGNLYVEGNADIDGQLDLGAIVDVEAAIGDNTSAIVVNASDIDVNEAGIATNASDIDVNEAGIATNASDIDVNEAGIATNASDIDVNEAGIATNASDIDVNEAGIATNASDIDVNEAGIATNASDIDVNEAGIATNASDIDVNEAGIAANATDIDNLEDLIFVDPHGNTHISGPNSDSLYTRYDEEDGNQKLGAIHDMEGADHPNIVDIDVVTNLNVSGAVTNDGPATLTVQKNDGETTVSASDDFTPIEPVFDAEGVVAGTVAVYTKINENTSLTESTDNSGFYADTEGNVRLFKNGGSDTTLDYVTAIRVDVYDDTNVEGVAGTVANQTEVGGYFDGDGNFVVLGELVDDGTVDGIGVLDATVFDDATLAAMADLGLYTIDTVDGDGGNLVVEGDAMVYGDSSLMGNLMLGEIADVEDAIGMNTAGVAANASTLVVHEGLVTTNIANIATNAAGIATNASTLVVHEGLVTTNIANIATNAAGIATNASTLVVHEGLVLANQANIATNASTLVVHEGLVLQNIADIATNASTLVVHEGLVTQNIADIAANASTLVVHEGLVLQNIADIETNENAIADAVGRLDYHEGLVLANIADIDSLQSSVATINSTLNTHFSLVSQNIQNIERNTRGIAMTAALTHTTILPGMENALDVSMAYFEGETGISISYSRRINEGTQINFAAASTSDFEETVVRGGVGWQW